MNTKGWHIVEEWFKTNNWEVFPFQKEVWRDFLNKKNGLLNAPTGSGKTFALWMPTLIKWIDQHPNNYQELTGNGLQLLWITPLRALAKDIQHALQTSLNELEIPWEVGRRTGDISPSIKQKQNRTMPEVLITTPESVHILFAQKLSSNDQRRQ